MVRWVITACDELAKRLLASILMHRLFWEGYRPGGIVLIKEVRFGYWKRQGWALSYEQMEHIGKGVDG